jgi:hypothetical protein
MIWLLARRKNFTPLTRMISNERIRTFRQLVKSTRPLNRMLSVLLPTDQNVNNSLIMAYQQKASHAISPIVRGLVLTGRFLLHHDHT